MNRHDLIALGEEIEASLGSIAEELAASASYSAIQAELRAVSERWHVLRTRCAKAGLLPHLSEGDDGRPRIVISRWKLTQHCMSLTEAAAWADQLLEVSNAP